MIDALLAAFRWLSEASEPVDQTPTWVHPSHRVCTRPRPLTAEAIALGKKPYLGPMTTRRERALTRARRNRNRA